MKKLMILFGALTMMVACSFSTNNVSAASKQKVISIKAGETKQIQLDGKGKKEKISWTSEVTKVPTSKPSEYDLPNIPVYDCTTVAKLTINGKVVDTEKYVAIRSLSSSAYQVELVITDIDKKDKKMDILFGENTGSWMGTYTFLQHMQYNNGRVSKDNMLKTLETVNAPNAPMSYGSELKEANLIESRKGLKGEFTTTGDGTLTWNICVAANHLGYGHGTTKLNLKNNKIRLSSKNVSGNINVWGNGIKSSNKLKFATSVKIYKDTKKKKVLYTIKKGDTVKADKFQYVNKKLFVKCTNAKKKTGWLAIADINYSSVEPYGTLHA